MIIDKLEEARLRSARRRMQIIVIILAVICLVSVVMFGLSLVDFSSQKASLPEVDSKTNISPDNKEQIRGAFREKLLEYENELEPRLQSIGLESWNRDGLFEITAIKDEMMSFYSSGEYSKALANLEKLEGQTLANLARAEKIFQEDMKKATSFLAEDLYDEAKLHVDKALVIAPSSTEAQALKAQIERLPLILPLLQNAKIARAENDYQKEQQFLQQIIAIAPEREEETARLSVLAEQIKKQNFETHVSSGFAAIEKKQLQEARYHYQQAEKIDPQRAELPLLSTQLSALEKSLRFQRYVEQAEQAINRDDWQLAKESFVKAAQDAPANRRVADGLQQAERIVVLQKRLAEYLDNPYRLVNSGTRKDAEKVLMDAENIANLSFTLQQQTKKLREMTAMVNRSVPVTIISDSKTYIEVRSVGKVGVVSEKIIQLKPGKYTFEGSRDGFKSKLVQAFISYDLESYSVHIICDEPI